MGKCVSCLRALPASKDVKVHPIDETQQTQDAENPQQSESNQNPLTKSKTKIKVLKQYNKVETKAYDEENEENDKMDAEMMLK